MSFRFVPRLSAVLPGLLLALLPFGALHAQAAAAVPATTTPAIAPLKDHPRTCLVLGGGGARGAAHIGVLKVLEREHVPIDCIVGTSMGAIVGGLYASGYKADEIEAILLHIDWSDVFRDMPARDKRTMRRKEDDLRWLGGVELGLNKGKITLPRGVVQGQKMQLLLRRLLLSTWQVDDWDRLPIPFRAIAADILTGEKVVLSSGDLAESIRASMSVPGVLEPVRIGDHLLVDGGIADNLPIDEARKLGGERLIVSSVGSPLLTEEQLTSPLLVTNQMLTALMSKQTNAQIATLDSDDLLIEPALGTFGPQAFGQGAEAVRIGFASADAKRDALQAFSVDAASYAAFDEGHRPLLEDPPMVTFVDVLAEDTSTDTYVASRLSDHVGTPLDMDALEDDLAEIYSEGRYQDAQWGLVETDSGTGLAIHAVDRPWGPDYLRLSLRVSDNFDGNSSYQLLSQLDFTGLNTRGGEARIGLNLGENTRFRGEFFQPFGTGSQQSLMPYVEYRASNVPILDTTEQQIAEYRRSQALVGVEWAFTPNRDWQLALGVQRGQDRAKRTIGDPDLLGNTSDDLGGYYVRGTYDSLDSSTFPTRGQRVYVKHDQFLPDFGSDVRADVTHLSWDAALSFDRNHFLVGGHVATSGGTDDIFAVFSPLGGLTNFSGYGESEILAPKTALARAIYYRRLDDADATFSLPVYVGGSIERGGAWGQDDKLTWDSMENAASLFLGIDSTFGPIFLGYGRSEDGHDAFYLTFGSFLRTLDGY